MRARKLATGAGNRKLERNRAPAVTVSLANKKLPAQNAGVRYETNRRPGFVKASPSRAFRDGAGTLLVKLSPHARRIP
jgi:hypothetical protein